MELTRNIIVVDPYFAGDERRVALIRHQKKMKTSLVLINRDDRMSSSKQSITNEVKVLWHKGFCLTSMKKREPLGE